MSGYDDKARAGLCDLHFNVNLKPAAAAAVQLNMYFYFRGKH